MKQIAEYPTSLAQMVLRGALEGRNAHVPPEQVLEGLKLNFTGKKILNTPYTIWQCLKHINYWQDKFISRLHGKEVKADSNWKEGWEEKLNAKNQKELEKEINLFIEGIQKVNYLLENIPNDFNESSDEYPNKFAVIQAMTSHISYHFGEIVLLRRIFGAWPPKSGGMVW